MALTKFKLVEIEILEPEAYDGVTYDLEVEEDHSYNIEGIIVHNSVCTTRIQTGVGYPQLSAIIECGDAAHQRQAHICSDGGCVVPGDVAKAFAGNSDFVMLGGIFAGHDECDGDIIERDGEKYIQFYGMSSKEAMDKYDGGIANYRSSEGKCVEVPYRGPIKNTILDILGGIRSTCTYVGARKLKWLSKHTTFIRVENQENRIFS